jgi:hypothetical protein
MILHDEIQAYIGKLISLIICSFLFIARNQPNASQSSSASNEDNKLESYNHDFKEYGFTLKAPCQMKDISAQAKGDFLVNYGGVTNPDDPNLMTAYQLIVSRLPIGYRNLSKSDLESKIDEIIQSSMSGMKNLKPVRIGYEEYKGYVGETTHNGMKQKGAIFLKDNYTISLTVLTNNDIETKFNAFTNGFKSIRKEEEEEVKNNDTSNVQNLSFGYSVSAPCTLKEYPSQEVDYSYSGAINPNNQDIAIVYKIQVTKLPICYSHMGDYDQKQIKKNLLSYLHSKDSYSECSVGVKKHLAYRTSYKEGEFKCKECMILTDNHVIELIVFSKKGVSETQFMDFVNSLRKN